MVERLSPNILNKRFIKGMLMTFFSCLTGKDNKNIKFSFETEGWQITFDVNVFSEKGKLVTNVYRRETCNGA